MVRLKEVGARYWEDATVKFQFQYGAIKSQLNMMQRKLVYSFNSNMVRLKVSGAA